jgi:hypothetical protein
MNSYERCRLTAAYLVAVLGVLVPGAASATAPAAPTPCDLQLRVELSPDVPNRLDLAFLNSLLGNHGGYRLTFEWQEPESISVFTVDLTGPGPETRCREVVDSMRRDARVVSIEVQGDAATAVPPVSTVHRPGSATTASGTVRAGPDGDWVLEPVNGVSYTQLARDRYECDIRAADQTGFDPTKDDGGLPPNGVSAKRVDYLRAEAACFQARGYLVRSSRGN